MKFIFKVVWERCDGTKDKAYYYESTSISALISYFSNIGAAVGYIVEIKRINRLPKHELLYKGFHD